jgi:hypothetical protein
MAGCLLVYAPSARGDAALRDELRSGEPVTVVSLAAEERPLRACCGIQSAFWNQVQREMAESELARARLAVEDCTSPDGVTLRVLAYEAGRPVRAIARHAAALGAERVVLADARASGLGRRLVRRLRGRCAAPVIA